MKPQISLLAAACAFLFGINSAVTCSASPSGRMSLDGQWRFALAPNAETAGTQFGKFFEASFDSSAFKPITVPSNWTTNDEFESPHYRFGTSSEGFYLHNFDAPASMKDRRVLLHFDGVWVSAEVWLNGENIGRHDSGFTAFALDITRAIKPGKRNEIAVRVRQQVQSYRFDTNDDWALPGIFRSVWIEDTPRNLYIESVGVRTKFDTEYRNAEVEMRAMISRNEKAYIFAPSPPFDLVATLSRDGKTIATQTYSGATITSGHNGRDVPITLHVNQPAAWTAETPNLYDLKVDLYYHDNLVHTWTDRIGIRDVSTAGGVLRVNGRIIKLRGVAHHDEHPDVGRATRPEHWRRDLELMKAANINTIRTAHYPHAEGFIKLCDEMGFYIINEIPLGYGGGNLNNPMFAEGAFLRMHETIARDRNRPSVIVWSFGNEDPLTSIHLAGIRATKGIDPTRPVLMPFRADTHLPPEIDILAPHYWKTDDYDRLAAASSRPIITTEYTHALGPDDFGELQQRFDTLTSHPTGAGGCIWLWADQGLRRPVNGRPVLHPMRDKKSYTSGGSELVAEQIIENGNTIIDAHGNDGADGIVNADRTPQRDYWETKSVYAPVRLLADRVAFKAGQQSIYIPVRNGFDFLDMNTVTFTWTLHRDAEVIDKGKAVLDAPPHVTTRLEIPASAISETTLRDHVYYADIAILRPDGSEMNRQSVRIGYESTPQPAAPLTSAPAAPKVETNAGLVAVIAGPARYEFNTSTGEIKNIALNNKQLAGNATLVMWRPATYSERNVLDKLDRQHDWDTFMHNPPPKLQKWNVASANDGVQITAKVEYRADDRNVAVANYTYTISNTGILRVALELEVQQLDAPFLPEIGLEFAIGKNPTRLTWLGHGPLLSTAGKTAAARFGWWSHPTTDAHSHGNKWNPDWARLEFAEGASLHIRHAQAVRLNGNEANGRSLRILTNQSGSWTKLFPPDRPEWHMDLEKTKTYRGLFEIFPMAPAVSP